MADDALFALGNFFRGPRNVGRDFLGDHQDAMFVRVQQIAGLHCHSADFHRTSEIQQMHMGVGDADSAREKMEPSGAHFIQVAHVAVGDATDAPQPLLNARHDFADVGSDPGRLVQVLQHQHARFGDFQ